MRRLILEKTGELIVNSSVAQAKKNFWWPSVCLKPLGALAQDVAKSVCG